MVCGRFTVAAVVVSALNLFGASTGLAQEGRGAAAPVVPPNFPKEPYANVTVMRDVAYGQDPVQKLDVFTPAAARPAPRTVVIFVHGGAYRGGDKHAAGDYGYDNIMLWAVRAGMVGINMNYRLFPGAGFPHQEEDVGAVVQWTKAHVATYGGDPNRIFLFGHSSGGAVVGNYASMPQFRRDASVRGVILLSSIMDLASYQTPWAYYGTTDKAKMTELSPQTNLAKSNVPVLMGHGDNDSVTVLPQMPVARAALCAAGHCPRLVVTQGDHQGVAHAVGGWGGDPTFGNAALAFIDETP